MGCSPANDDAVAETVPPPQTFEGTVDKTLVGNWTSDGGQKLALSDDGTAHMTGSVNTPGGKKEINESMEWKVSGKKLSFKMSSGTIQQYDFAIDNDALQMKTAKTSTTYKKTK